MNNNEHFPNNINTSNTFPNSLYAPFGVNDNNFNRKSVPSNIFPNNGEMTGNPTGRFNPISTNSQYLMKTNPDMSNFNIAFNQNTPIIEKLDYTNKNNLLHNNIADVVLGENIIEYRINIDSLDRDIRYYPNPFAFTVKFSPASNGTFAQEEYIDHKNKSKGKHIIETKMDGTPTPYINRKFRNVKYVKLENIILPQYSKINKNKEGKYEFDADSHLNTERFVSLVINELICDRVYTTSQGVTRMGKNGNFFSPPTPFAIIIPDKCIGSCFYSGTPYYGSIIYKNSLLANLNQLTIRFFDSYGEPICFNGLFTYDELQQYEFDKGKPLPINDLRNPYNSKMQLNFSLIIGVVESEINTIAKFEH